MSILFFDGFDFYTHVLPTGEVGQNDLTTRWNTQSGGIFQSNSYPSLIPGRYGGQALRFSFMGYLAKTLPNSYHVLTVGFSFRFIGDAPCYVSFSDARYGGTGCSLQVQVDGSISVSSNGVVVARTGVGVIVPNRWASIEFQATFAQNGYYEVWVDGASVIRGQANMGTQYCDVVLFAINWNIFEAEKMDIDDVYVSSDTGQPPHNARNLGAWRVEARFPTGDTEQKDLIPQSPVLGQFDPAITGAGTSYGQAIVLQRVTSRVTGTVPSGRLYWTQTGTAKVKCVVYTDSEFGTPAAVLGVSEEVIGATVTFPAIATAVDYTFATPPVLLAGRSYWIGYIADRAMTVALESVQGATTWVGLNEYAAGAPALPGVTAVNNKLVPMTFATTTTANYVCVNEPATDDEGSYVYTTTGGEDIYLLDQWLEVPVEVWAVNVLSRGRKLTQGAAWYQHRLQSQWTDYRGRAFAPGVNWQYNTEMLPRDPNTGAPWTGKAVNALRVGVTVHLGDAPALDTHMGITPAPLDLP